MNSHLNLDHNNDNQISNSLTTLNEIRKQLSEISLKHNKTEDELVSANDHLNNLEFLILNQHFIISSKYKLFGEAETKKHQDKLDKPEYAKGLIIHFEHVAGTNGKQIEINAQIEEVFNAYKTAIEKDRLEGFFASLNFGACAQAKSTAMDTWRKNALTNQHTLDELMREYLWIYGKDDQGMTPHETNAYEREVMIKILTNHRGQQYVDENGTIRSLNFEVVKKYLVKIKYFDEENVTDVPKELKNPKQAKTTDVSKPSKTLSHHEASTPANDKITVSHHEARTPANDKITVTEKTKVQPSVAAKQTAETTNKDVSAAPKKSFFARHKWKILAGAAVAALVVGGLFTFGILSAVGVLTGAGILATVGGGLAVASTTVGGAVASHVGVAAVAIGAKAAIGTSVLTAGGAVLGGSTGVMRGALSDREDQNRSEQEIKNQTEVKTEAHETQTTGQLVLITKPKTDGQANPGMKEIEESRRLGFH